MDSVHEITRLLKTCTKEQRYQIFRQLRQEFTLHPIETNLNTKAEIILDAIQRGSDLTLRGIRGIIAECTFALEIVQNLEGWEGITPKGDHPYDFLLRDKVGEIRVQVKMQRQEKHAPKILKARKAWSFLPSDMYAVETQRTRGGKNSQTGEKTRPYTFNQFDIPAVSMQPSTKKWGDFLYTVSSWLLPSNENPNWLRVLQPVPQHPNGYWTDNFLDSVGWFRSNIQKQLYSDR